jgi:hypothetical protein
MWDVYASGGNSRLEFGWIIEPFDAGDTPAEAHRAPTQSSIKE